ncbi:MAG: IS1380 family transposase, partial [Actinomycetota bacterium]|nr:IS1380 family transposase [Actinomycetota bacterium]
MSVRVGTTDRAITAFGGAELLREAAGVVGLAEELDDWLTLKRRARGLSDTEFVMGMAESIALGASCLDDLGVSRADVAQAQLRGFEIPAPQTAGAWLRRFTLGHIRQLSKALLRAQRKAFVAAGVERVTLDFDSTYVFSRSRRRQGVDRTYKKGYALHPLLCFDAESGAAVHARLRRGKAGASTGISTFVTEALRAVPDDVGVRVRFDSGFYSGPLFAQLEKAGVTYLCGAPLSAPILEAVSQIADEYWVSCPDEKGEVAEFGYRLKGGDGPFRRYVVKRIEVPPGKQASWEGGYRYWVFVTNDHLSDAAVLEAEHRQKAVVETGMAELKSNFGLSAFRKHGFMANWAWLLVVCLGHNLCCWAQHLGALAGGRGNGELRAKRLR